MREMHFTNDILNAHHRRYVVTSKPIPLRGNLNLHIMNVGILIVTRSSICSEIFNNNEMSLNISEKLQILNNVG